VNATRVATGSRRAYAILVFIFVSSTLCQRPSLAISVPSHIPVRSVLKCHHSASSWTSTLFGLPGYFIALHLSVRGHNWGAIRDVVSCPNERPAAPGGRSRMAGRRPLSPRKVGFPPRFFSSIQHGVAKATSRGRCSRTSFVSVGWDDHHDAPWDRDAETLSPQPAVFFKPCGDGADAVSAALSRRRRRCTGGTPDRTDAMRALGPPNGASSWPAACASHARQVKSRADMARVMAAAAEAKATAELMCPLTIRAAADKVIEAEQKAMAAIRVADEELESALGAAEAAAAEAKAAEEAAAQDAAAGVATEATASVAADAGMPVVVYLSPLSEWE